MPAGFQAPQKSAETSASAAPGCLAGSDMAMMLRHSGCWESYLSRRGISSGGVPQFSFPVAPALPGQWHAHPEKSDG